MNSESESYHDRLASIRNGLAQEAGKSIVLIEELLSELDLTKQILSKTNLDLDNERDARRRLQQEINDMRGSPENHEQKPFIVALIDADYYIFNNKLINRGEEGGKDAADALLANLHQFEHNALGGRDKGDIVVKAYADFKRLGSLLQRTRKIQDQYKLRIFAAGFSGQQPLFDFIDVGTVKSQKDDKIQESVKFYLGNSQCRQVILACPDNQGVSKLLGQITRDGLSVDRVTLAEESPLSLKVKNRNLKTNRLGLFFNTELESSRDHALSSFTSEARSKRDNSLKGSKDKTETQRRGPAGYNFNAQPERLGPTLTDENGNRIDKPLQVDPKISDRIKKESLCYYFYLRGECITDCQQNHSHPPLTDAEFDALWEAAREKECRKGKDCLKTLCFYGHTGNAGS